MASTCRHVFLWVQNTQLGFPWPDWLNLKTRSSRSYSSTCCGQSFLLSSFSCASDVKAHSLFVGVFCVREALVSYLDTYLTHMDEASLTLVTFGQILTCVIHPPFLSGLPIDLPSPLTLFKFKIQTSLTTQELGIRLVGGRGGPTYFASGAVTSTVCLDFCCCSFSAELSKQVNLFLRHDVRFGKVALHFCFLVCKAIRCCILVNVKMAEFQHKLPIR
ncbi:hypothetical protein GDO81_021382 [Engystomops pustulosus]|uniref:Uncharacterized protein n=1 Tax=Engystomops pustulosus TaxID=76066 RepID=A0AAV6YW01_ENGPU|nr:hypothetical protein GDO81_021382 [Engystomops pustulosus]